MIIAFNLSSSGPRSVSLFCTCAKDQGRYLQKIWEIYKTPVLFYAHDLICNNNNYEMGFR